MTRTFIVIFFGLVSGAVAGDLPRFPVEKYCDKIARFGGGYSELSYLNCMDSEQLAYDKMKPNWNDVPKSMQDYCIRIAQFGGVGSYSSLANCVDSESKASEKNKSRSFKY